MTQDEIISLAREAGLLAEDEAWVSPYQEAMERFAALVAAHERENQAEQEPVAVVEITYGREPECYVTGNIDDFPEGVFKLYAAPVRTKDLTGEEIERILTEQPNGEHMNLHWFYNAARAVIAADREKNK